MGDRGTGVTKVKNRNKAAGIITVFGMIAMAAISFTQMFPAIAMADVAVWVGLVSFFVVEGLTGTSGKESGLRFSTIGTELRNRTVLWLIFLLICTQIFSVVIGFALFSDAFIDYDLGRALDVMESKSAIKLLLFLPISGWGEEIAWRGFFLGKKNEKIPFWIWTVISSALFAIGHFSQHASSIVMYGLSINFICGLIFCCLFHRTRNCMISTIAHVIGNYAEVLFILLVF